MKLDFYKCSDDPRTVNKSLGSKILSLDNCTLKENCNLLDPVFKVSWNEAITRCNYLYSSTFQRYYFIKDITYSKQCIYITCHVDALTSWKKDLLKCGGIIKRSAAYHSKDLYDDKQPTYEYKFLGVKGSGSVLSKSGSFIMAFTGNH